MPGTGSDIFDIDLRPHSSWFVGCNSCAAANGPLVGVWMQVPKLVEVLGRLVRDNLVALAFTEYQLPEFPEALDHALDSGRNTKILLIMNPSDGY